MDDFFNSKSRFYLARPPVSILHSLPAVLYRSSSSPLVEVRNSTGKGLGVFATCFIPAFSRILLDSPIVTIVSGEDLEQIYQRFQGLPDFTKGEYLSLHTSSNPDREHLLERKLKQRGYEETTVNKMKEVASVFQNNAFNLTVESQDEKESEAMRCVFPLGARLNHSCVPNAHSCFYPPSDASKAALLSSAKGGKDEIEGVSNKLHVHALRDIKSGEEITISYLNIVLARGERQQKTLNWGFICDCPGCVGKESAVEEQEKKRGQIRESLTFSFPETTKLALFSSSPFQARGYQNLTVWTAADQEYLWEMAERLQRFARNESFLRPALPGLYEFSALVKYAKAFWWTGAEETGEEQKRADFESVIDYFREAAIAEERICGKDSPDARKKRNTVLQLESLRDVEFGIQSKHVQG